MDEAEEEYAELEAYSHAIGRYLRAELLALVGKGEVRKGMVA